MDKKSDKKGIRSAFEDILGKNKKKESEPKAEEIKEALNEKKYKEIVKDKNYQRRLTIPLSRMQEKYLEDFIHEIHQNRNRKSQRLTKASLIRAMINTHYAMIKNFDKMEINNEDSLNERFYIYYKKR